MQNMNNYQQFQTMLKAEQIFENRVINLFQKLYSLTDDRITKTEANVKNSDYDFKVDEIGYEIKNNHYSLKSGNICIEYKNHGKLSGISITKSEYQLHSFYGKYIVKLNTEKLKAFLRENYRTSLVRDVPSGDFCRDGSKSGKSLLISVVSAIDLAEEIYNIESETILDKETMKEACLQTKNIDSRTALNIV